MAGCYGKQWDVLGNDGKRWEKRWEAMGNDGKQWDVLGNFGKQWETMGKVGIKRENVGTFGKRWETMGNNGKCWDEMGSHISLGISHFSVGIWDPTVFPMLPNVSHRIPKIGGIQWHTSGTNGKRFGK